MLKKKEFKLKNPMHMILILLVILASTPLTVLFSAWTISVVWGWFITPAFNIAVPSLLNIAGLLIFWNFLLAKKVEEDFSYVEDEFDLFKAWLKSMVSKVVGRNLGLLGVCYLVKLFM